MPPSWNMSIGVVHELCYSFSTVFDQPFIYLYVFDLILLTECPKILHFATHPYGICNLICEQPHIKWILGCDRPDWYANGICNDLNNNEACLFDGGDCCGPCNDYLYCSQCQCLSVGEESEGTAASTLCYCANPDHVG